MYGCPQVQNKNLVLKAIIFLQSQNDLIENSFLFLKTNQVFSKSFFVSGTKRYLYRTQKNSPNKKRFIHNKLFLLKKKLENVTLKQNSFIRNLFLHL